MNTRGLLIDEQALIAALKEKRIAGAGLDVFDRELRPSDHPLRRLDNVVATPHLGYVTLEGYRVFMGMRSKTSRAGSPASRCGCCKPGQYAPARRATGRAHEDRPLLRGFDHLGIQPRRDGSRFPSRACWPGVLQAALGTSYRVEEGLSGCTVATDSWILPHYRDGRSMLGPLLESHATARLLG